MKKAFRIFITFTVFSHVAISQIKASELSPDEVYERMFQNAQVTVKTATGKYYKKRFSSSSATNSEKPSEVDKSIEPDNKQVTVTIEDYYLSGSKFRKDQWTVPEMDNDQEIMAYLKQLHPNPDSIFTWDGRTYSTLAPSKLEGDPSVGLGPGPNFLSLTSNPGHRDKPAFLAYGREVESKNLLKLLREQGQPVSIEKTSWNGNEEALLLRIGEKGSVGFLMEMTILPNKGYVLARSRAMWGGAPQVEEEYGDFIQTSAGFWVPLKIKRLAYKLSENQVPFISSSVEMIAIEEPKVNIEIADSIFDCHIVARTLYGPDRNLIVSDQRNGQNKNYQIPVIDFFEQLNNDDVVSFNDQTPKDIPTNAINEYRTVNSSVEHKKEDDGKVKAGSADTRKGDQEKRNRILFWQPIIVGISVFLIGISFFALYNHRRSRR
jgi:hypothetical protein